jgi:hypothetical protein
VGGLAHGAEGNAMRELCDPLSFSRAKARNLTSIYATVQPRLASRILARMLCTTVAPANALSGLAAERAVEIIASMGDPRQFEKGLCPLPDHANPRIRSKIALLVVQARSDAPLAGLHIMMEPDARIRDVLVCAA